MVVDASAIVDLLLGHEPEASWVASQLIVSAGRVQAPHLLDVEVIGALRRLERRRQLTRSRATQAVTDFLALRLERYPHARLLQRVWRVRGNLTAADAVYVALAEALCVPLLTTDRALGRTRGHQAEIVAFPG